MFAPSELLWALIGLILTIGSTWLEAFGFAVPATWLRLEGGGLEFYALGVSFQVGAAMFTGCMGGKNAAALSQVAYLMLGIVLFPRFEFEVFTQGAGLSYLREPSFGYLLGFVPGGWLCGKLAFQRKPTLERLAFASLSGLLMVHLCGVAYLLLGHLFGWIRSDPSLFSAIVDYSIERVPGQIMVVCAISLIAFGMRKMAVLLDGLGQR